MRKTFAAIAVAMLLVACGGQPSQPHHEAVVAPDSDPSPETFALGTEVSPAGFVPQQAAGSSFARGGELYLSVDVSGASTDQQIAVEWRDQSGRVMRRESRHIGEGGHYAAFSSGRTARWDRGPHRAIVTINGRKVSEKNFALL